MATNGSARSRDGVRLSYTLHEGGSSSARVALVHSVALDRSVWDRVVAQLLPRASVLVYDARGHGASEKPPGPYSVELFADDLAALLDAVGWERAVIGGASMGGCVALAFAIGYPGRLEGLTLIDTTAWYGENAAQAWEERAQKAATDGFASLIDFQVSRWFGDAFRAANAALVRHYTELFLKNDLAAYQASCRMLGAADLRAGTPGVRAPVAILVGEEDYATPVAMAQELQRLIPGATLRVIPGARHLTPIDAPEQVAAGIASVLDPAAVR